MGETLKDTVLGKGFINKNKSHRNSKNNKPHQIKGFCTIKDISQT